MKDKTLCFAMIASLVLGSSAGAADWPTLRGPHGSGSADSGLELLDDPAGAKLLWKSEEQDIPGGYAQKIEGISGGYCGPVVGEGAVVVAYYIPNGEVYDEKLVAEAVEKAKEAAKPRSWWERRYSINADDIVLCIDAETGKTRWKRRFAEKGLNHSKYPAGPLLTPCIADGRVYALGTAARVYCLDIKDGKVLWETGDWPGGRRFDADRQEGLKNRKMPYYFQNAYKLCTGPVLAGGVVAVTDYCADMTKRQKKNYGLVGLDAATGKFLWQVADCMGGVTSPVPWLHRGKQYFIAAAPNRLTCIEAATGAVAWDYRGHVNKLGTPAVSGDVLVCGGTGSGFSPRHIAFKDKQKHGVLGFRMDDRGARRLWSLQPKQHADWTSPVIYKGHAYTLAGRSLACIDVETGDIRGTIKFKYGGYYSSPVAADGRLIFRTTLYNADPKAFRALGVLQTGKTRVPIEVWTTPAIADGKFYVRAPREGRSRYRQKMPKPGCIYCYDLRKAG
jgi:outer membrane protein assembly factor BamB